MNKHKTPFNIHPIAKIRSLIAAINTELDLIEAKIKVERFVVPRTTAEAVIAALSAAGSMRQSSLANSIQDRSYGAIASCLHRLRLAGVVSKVAPAVWCLNPDFVAHHSQNQGMDIGLLLKTYAATREPVQAAAAVDQEG